MYRLVAVLAVVAVVACGGRGAGQSAHFARGIGLATASETMEKTAAVLELHQFEVERTEGPPSIYYETRWRDRAPFADEQGLGVQAAQIRAVVRARPRSTTSTMGEVYSVDMSIEQRVRMAGGTEWRAVTLTPEARAYAQRIAEDLRRELNVGVRRF